MHGRFAPKSLQAAIPSSPRNGNASTSFDSVKIPWMLMPGTRDVALIGDADVPSRLAVFPALPSGHKYGPVHFDADHSAFTDRALPGRRAERTPNPHRVILAVSTAFYDAFLQGGAPAGKWLEGEGPRLVLEPRVSWRWKEVRPSAAFKAQTFIPSPLSWHIK